MKVAIVSMWHVHARAYIQEARQIDGVEVAAIWDENPERGRQAAGELGIRFESEYDALLSDPSIDGIILCAPTAMHTELILQAARAGKHIFTEKVLAIEPEEAARIQQVIEETGVKFAISFPHRTRSELLFVKKLIETGELGTTAYARVHNCHNGSSGDWLPADFYDASQTGGGAMIDLGAHGLYLLPWLLGKPLSIQSSFTQIDGRGVEDNAVSVLCFEGGAIGVAETGFVHRFDPFRAEVTGSKGSIIVQDGEPIRICCESTGGSWLSITDDQLPVRLPSAMQQWVNAVELQMGTLFDIYEAVELTRLMKAAYESAQSGRVIAV